MSPTGVELDLDDVLGGKDRRFRTSLGVGAVISLDLAGA
jgi:hypothetical protein